ncbi:rhomboid family intramembrane serine protease [Pseudoxanthomonas composti]|uniref:Rhomboid family intramembrane serine protease n=1 Tax=Pseudoxanthomonas composti TaxID=2137479 RepID=A0A4Q1JU75_9GAMM|nr:rhomboid family intramembrane serine protease [Pseudoxanthomonas composti]RXR05174.1 rhomboid family intramembrane serine protease [Pseudoxanthomonas composti]
MLILPLHKPLNRANFPVATMLLVLANVVVFFGFQLRDARALGQAMQVYRNQDLARLEVPAYERHLLQTRQAGALSNFRQVPEQQRAAYVAMHGLTDVAFLRALQSGRLFDTPDTLPRWQQARAPYQARLEQVFTYRHILRSSEWSLHRMLSSAFLHADFMHLLGNMLFLTAIGLLLEGAIGPWRFAGVYLLGALGSSAVSLWWRAGEAGGGLGASGAIAAMMGAFCVVWGRHPVRFFYWIGVVFDYVRAPAIWLLPVWLGWEVWNLLTNTGAGIGFDAHAGGLVTGALLGAMLVASGQRRLGFMLDLPEVPVDDRFERAQRHIGRMENAEAERLLAELAIETPHHIEIARARYLVARNSGQPAAIQSRALALLAIPAADAAQAQLQFEAWQASQAQGAHLEPALRAGLIQHWLALGLDTQVEHLLAASAADMAPQELAQHWFKLALHHRSAQAHDKSSQLLQQLVARFPDLPQAEKARFLLHNA